jgi:hypothetical protein
MMGGCQADALKDVLGLHGADGDVLDDQPRSGPMEQLAFHLLLEHGERRVREEWRIRQHAEELDAVLRQPLLEHPGQRGVGIVVDLVHDGAGDLDPVSGEEGMVEHDLVDGPTDPRLADDDGASSEHPGHGRVGEVDDRADTGMTRALDQEHLAIAATRSQAERSARRSRPLPLMSLGEAATCTGLMSASGSGRLSRLHEDGILVGRHAVDHRVALTDRLDEAGSLQAATEASAASRPSETVVLPRFMPAAARYN